MRKLSLIAIIGLLLFACISPLSAALITQCPAVGLDTGCGILITVTAISASGAATAFTVTAATAPTQPPFEGAEDTLIGIQNNATADLKSIALSSTTDIFGFDGDGICTVTPHPSGCPFATTGPGADYAGPGVSFSGISAAGRFGVVNFNPAVAAGGSTYFGLEEALTPSQIQPGVPEPGTMALMGTGLGALLLFVRRKTA